MQTAHAAFQVSDAMKSFLNVLLVHWPIIIGAALFSIGASGLMPRGKRNNRRQRKSSADGLTTQPRSIRIPLSLAILAVSVILFVWGLLSFQVIQ